jgi:hypothetical protein
MSTFICTHTRFLSATKAAARPLSLITTGNNRDEVDVNALKPMDAVYATIDLLYQGTSWEYIQFQRKGNNSSNVFLGEKGVYMLDAWINADVPVAMQVGGDRQIVPPVVMASTARGTPPTVNVPPGAVNGSNTTAQDTQLSAPAPGVLANDSDTDGDPLTAVYVPNGELGSVNLNADDSFTYAPPAGLNGEDHFTCQASDGSTVSNLATVNINVTATGGNNAPIANDDSYGTPQDTARNVLGPNAQTTCHCDNKKRTCLPIQLRVEHTA